MNLLELSLVACAAMAANDVITTLLTVAEARGRASLAGALDPLGTIARVLFYSYSGEQMLHGHGAAGWLAFAPVLVVDYLSTRITTAWGRRLKESPASP